MRSKPTRAALFLMVAACVLVCPWISVQAQGPTRNMQRIAAYDLASTDTVYSQPAGLSGTLLQSSWWDPNGSDYDQYVWDGFALPSNHEINAIQWRGGYDPTKFGSGGPVVDFTVAIYASIAAGTQPDVGSPPLVEYHTGGNAGETLVGTFGSTRMYDYSLALSTPFHAVAGVKYWVQIEATQNNIPDWGLAQATSGDGKYFRKIANVGDIFYQLVPGDAAFTLLGPTTVIQHTVYVPIVLRATAR
jgi:hypothetical protein